MVQPRERARDERREPSARRHALITRPRRPASTREVMRLPCAGGRSSSLLPSRRSPCSSRRWWRPVAIRSPTATLPSPRSGCGPRSTAMRWSVRTRDSAGTIRGRPGSTSPRRSTSPSVAGIGGLAVAAAAVMVASTVLAVWIVGRVEGGAGAWVVGLTLLGWTVTVGTTWFDNFWNPLVAIGPCLVVGIAAAALAAGRGWCLPLLVGFGSLAIQTHIGSAPAVVGMAAPAMIALALGGWRHLGRRPAGLAILTLAVLWVLPLWEQLTSSPGNVTELITFARTSDGAHAVADIAPQLGPQLSLLHVDLIEDSIETGFDADAGWWTVGAGRLHRRSRRPRLRQPPPTTAIRSGALRGGMRCGRLDDVELPPHRRSCLRLPLRVGRGGGRSGVVRDLAHGRSGALARWTAAGRRHATEHLVAVVVTLSLVVTLHAVLPAQRARLQAERAIPAEVSAATRSAAGGRRRFVDGMDPHRSARGLVRRRHDRQPAREGWPTFRGRRRLDVHVRRTAPP